MELGKKESVAFVKMERDRQFRKATGTCGGHAGRKWQGPKPN